MTRENTISSFRTMTAVAALFAFGCPAFAAPEGGNVVSGQASISQSGATTNVNQSSQKAIIDWQKFSINASETVNFNQPNASAVTLNRVIGGEKSVIEGALNANGQVFLVNSAGVLMGKGASVNTAGFVASTLNITNEDFNAGNYSFEGNSQAEVINLGDITAKEGGYVALLGRTVSNQGVITATKGTVSLNGASKVTLNFNGDSLASVVLDEGALNTLVENKQAIYADGGRVILTAKAADDLLGAAVNNTGIVQARTMDDLTGNIEVYAHGGTATVAGTLDASAPGGGNGGFIETSGDKVKIADSAVITTKSATGENGTWLIDPDGFTIGANGDMSGTALSRALTQGNVSIASTDGSGTNGNIVIDDQVNWSANILSLTATKNININNVVTVTGSGSLSAAYGSGTNDDATAYGLYTLAGAPGTFAGRIDFTGSGTVKMGVTGSLADYVVINTVDQFKAVYASATTLGKKYVLGSDIDFNSTTLTGSYSAFNSVLNGFGHRVENVVIAGARGLFSTLGTAGAISNLGLRNATINNAISPSGLLVGTNNGRLSNVFASGSIDSTGMNLNIGGLVGSNAGTIARAYADVTIVAGNMGSNVGGLVGYNTKNIYDSHSSGSVSTLAGGTPSVGGLVGTNHGSITRSYSTATVQGVGARAGGLVGYNGGSGSVPALVTASYATGNVSGTVAGGFVGVNSLYGSIANSYSTGSVTAQTFVYTDMWDMTTTYTAYAGGFVGQNNNAISTSYSSGQVTSDTANKGGFAGSGATYYPITNSYWDIEKSGMTTDGSPGGAIGLSGTDARNLASYVGFDQGSATSVWGSSAEGHPILRLLTVSVTPTVTKEYGSDYTLNDFTFQGLQWGDTASRFAYGPAVNVLSPSGFLNAGGYAADDLISSSAYGNIAGRIVVLPKSLTVSGVSIANKVYDATTVAAVLSAGTLNGFVGSETLGIAQANATFSDKNAGADKTVLLNYILADGGNGGLAANYRIVTTSTASIAKKTVTAESYGADGKVYDGSAAAVATLGALQGVYGGDVVQVSSLTGTFADANAGMGKTVTLLATLGGSDSGNYQIDTIHTTADITPRAILLGGAKVADGTTTANASGLQVVNLVEGDTLHLAGSVGLAGSQNGVQAITDFSTLTLDNANYTLAGAVGTVNIGNNNQMLSAVISGNASVLRAGDITTVTQTTDRAIIDWLKFSIAANETVIFDQPNALSVTLNQVIGNERSLIEGALQANGRIFLINSNGVMFGAGSSVNVGGLVASSLNLSNTAFLAGNYAFLQGNGSAGSVVNLGEITVADGGYAVFLGKTVDNTGRITASGGDVVLVGGEAASLTMAGNGTLTGHTATQLDGTVTLGGQIDVSSASASGGRIAASGGSLKVADAISVNAVGAGGAAGTLRLTVPGDLVVGSGGVLGGATLGRILDSANVGLISTGGNVNLNAATGWSANTLSIDAAKDVNVANVVTVNGTGNLQVSWGVSKLLNQLATAYDQYNKPQYLVDVHGINMLFGKNADGSNNNTFAGRIDFTGNGTVKMGSTGNLADYVVIRSVADLQAINQASANMSKNYVLGADLDLSTVADWTPLGLIGGTNTAFSGSFNGFGHTIANLTSTRNGLFHQIASTLTVNEVNPQTSAYTGNKILSVTPGVYNLGLTAVDIRIIGDATTLGDDTYVGALAGYSGGTFKNVFATGSINAQRTYAIGDIHGVVGGLVGHTQGTIDNAYASVNLDTDGYSRVGGFAGSVSGVIANSYATGNVLGHKTSGSGMAGGFAAVIGNGGIVYNAKASGSVQHTMIVGGFAGYLVEGRIYSSEATGAVTLDDRYTDYQYASNPYADGVGAGGFIGTNSGVIVGSRSSGRVTSSSGRREYLGGFSGYDTFYEGGLSIGNYWNRETSGMNVDGRGTGILPPDHQHGSGTPIADFLGLTPAELHGGGMGLTADEFAQMQNGGTLDQIRGDRANAAQQTRMTNTAISLANTLVGTSLQGVDGSAQGLLSHVAGLPISATGNDLIPNDGLTYSADIKGIEVDGVRYDLEDTRANPGLPSGETQDEEEK